MSMQTDCRQTDRLTTAINISVSCHNKIPTETVLQRVFSTKYPRKRSQENFRQKHLYTTVSQRDVKELELFYQNQLHHSTPQTSCNFTTAELILRSE